MLDNFSLFSFVSSLTFGELFLLSFSSSFTFGIVSLFSFSKDFFCDLLSAFPPFSSILSTAGLSKAFFTACPAAAPAGPPIAPPITGAAFFITFRPSFDCKPLLAKLPTIFLL